MTRDDDFVRGPAGRVGRRRRRPAVGVIVFTVGGVATPRRAVWGDPGGLGEQRISIVRPDGQPITIAFDPSGPRLLIEGGVPILSLVGPAS